MNELHNYTLTDESSRIIVIWWLASFAATFWIEAAKLIGKHS